MNQGVAVARHWIVHGRVQGVSFRWFTEQRAQALGVKGWVRNRMDGTVEVEALGPSEALDALHGHLLQGPPMARVERIDTDDLDPSTLGFESFTVRY